MLCLYHSKKGPEKKEGGEKSDRTSPRTKIWEKCPLKPKEPRGGLGAERTTAPKLSRRKSRIGNC